MSNINLQSTSDTPEQISAALGIKIPAAKAPVKAETEGESEGDEPEHPELEPGNENTGGESAEKPAKKGGFQKRIDKLTADKFRLDAENRLLKEQLAGKPAEKPEEKTPAAAATEDKEPKPEDFDGDDAYEKYIRAVTRWEVRQEKKADKENEQKTQQETARKDLIAKHTERLNKAREKYSDFDDVTGQELPISSAMEDCILESEKGAMLAYWLGSNPEECTRISRLTPTAAARELGKIEATLEDDKSVGDEGEQTEKPERQEKPVTPKPRVTSAPAPIKPVGAKAPANQKKPEDMTPAEYRAYREAGGGK